MADDDLHEKIRKFGASVDAADSEPPESESDRPSQVTIRWELNKGKIKWGRTIAACLFACGSIAEVVVELLSKDGFISKLVALFHH